MAAPDYAASPLGSFPELANMYQTNFSSPLSNAQTQVQYSQDQVAVENAKKAEAAAKERAAAFADAKNYTVQSTQNGGYKFFGPDGHEVTAAQYANNTGQKLTDVLKDSTDPIDIRYIQDQNNMTNYLKAKAQSSYDPKQRAIAQEMENEVKNSYGLDLNKTKPSDLIKYMQANYPTIYGPWNHNPGFSGSNTFLPTSGGAQAQAETDNPAGFYQPSNGSLGNLKRK